MFAVDVHWYYLNSFARMKKKKILCCLILLRELHEKEGLIFSLCLDMKRKPQINCVRKKWQLILLKKQKKSFLEVKDDSAKRLACSFVLRSGTMKICNTSCHPSPLEIKTKGILHISLVFRPRPVQNGVSYIVDFS